MANIAFPEEAIWVMGEHVKYEVTCPTGEIVTSENKSTMYKSYMWNKCGKVAWTKNDHVKKNACKNKFSQKNNVTKDLRKNTLK